MSTPWFPRIFSDKCDGCAKTGTPRCVEFCQHGVFTFQEGKAQVAQPLNCVNGCNACQSLCHSKAITFPKPANAQNIPKDKGMIRKTVCSGCGKTFWTNRESNFCFDCKNKRQEATK